MFKNSNYLEIWNQLTEYYERVGRIIIGIKYSLSISGEYSGAGWRPVYRGSTLSSAKRGEIS